MAYNPPEFSQLCIYTLNLPTLYSVRLNRYEVTLMPPLMPSVPLRKELTSPEPNILQTTTTTSSTRGPLFKTPTLSKLEILMANIDSRLEKSKTTRRTEVDIFTTLSEDMRQHLQKKDDKERSLVIGRYGVLILLGALLYRYFRIIKQYKEGVFFKMWADNPQASDLFQDIRAILNLTAVDAAYLSKDLVILDVTTVVTSLQAFKEYMTEINPATNLIRYFGYQHLQYNFITSLDKILVEHENRDKPVIQQFKAINFVHSLAGQLDEEKQKITAGFEEWCTALESVNKSLTIFTISQVIDHLQAFTFSKSFDVKNKYNGKNEFTFTADYIKNEIIKILMMKLIADHLSEMNYDTFKQNFEGILDYILKFVLFGGYELVLSSLTGGSDKSLVFLLHEALGMGITPDVLTVDDKLKGINCLITYLDKTDYNALNTDFFKNMAGMKQLVLSRKELLSKEHATASPVLVSS